MSNFIVKDCRERFITAYGDTISSAKKNADANALKKNCQPLYQCEYRLIQNETNIITN